MRILQIGKYYPPYKGGMETVLRDLCEGLLDRGHAVRVLVAGTEAEDRRETIHGIDPRYSGSLIRCASFGTIASQPMTPTLPSHLRRALVEFAPDVVQVHLPNPLAAGLLIAMRRQLPAGTLLTAWYHADIKRQRLGRRLVGPIVRRLLEACDGVAVSSRALIRHSENLRPDDHRLRVIPFGILPERWRRERSAPGADTPFLFIGRLVYYKGLRILLDAMAQLPGARLAIVGDGPLARDLAAEIKSRALESRIELIGEIDDDRLARLMAASRALVMPSDQTSETFGLVQLEAMVAELPVISSRLPTGVAGINRHRETGLQIEPGDVEALRSAMAEILDDSDRAADWGRAGRQRVIETFHRDTMVEALETWFRELALVSETTRNLAHGF